MDKQTSIQYWNLSNLERELFDCHINGCSPFNTCIKCKDIFTKIMAIREINELRKIEEKYRELLEEVSYKRLNR